MLQEPDRRSILGAAVAAGLMLGAPAAAQTGPAASAAGAAVGAFLLVVGRTTDRARILRYAASLPPIYAAHGGSYLALGAPGRGVRFVEGALADRSVILAEFPDVAARDGFWWGEAYRAAVRLRDGAGVFTCVGLTGLAAPHRGAGCGYAVVQTGPLQPGDARQAEAALEADDRTRASILASGGRVFADAAGTDLTPLEGDSLFTRVLLASWPEAAARDAWWAGRSARAAARTRGRAGLSSVALLDAFLAPPGR